MKYKHLILALKSPDLTIASDNIQFILKRDLHMIAAIAKMSESLSAIATIIIETTHQRSWWSQRSSPQRSHRWKIWHKQVSIWSLRIGLITEIMAITWKKGFTCKVAASSTLEEKCVIVIAAIEIVLYPPPKCETIRRTRLDRIASVTGRVGLPTFIFMARDTCRLVDSCKQQQQ